MDPCHCATVPTISPPGTPSPIMYTCPGLSYPVNLPLFFDPPGPQGARPVLNTYPACHLHHLFESGLQTTGRLDRTYVITFTLQEQKLPKEPKAVSKFGQQWVASAELGLACCTRRFRNMFPRGGKIHRKRHVCTTQRNARSKNGVLVLFVSK